MLSPNVDHVDRVVGLCLCHCAGGSTGDDGYERETGPDHVLFPAAPNSSPKMQFSDVSSALQRTPVHSVPRFSTLIKGYCSSGDLPKAREADQI